MISEKTGKNILHFVRAQGISTGTMLRIVLIITMAVQALLGKAYEPRFYPKKKNMLIGEKKRIYYQLDTTSPLIYQLEGPLEVRVISRIDGVSEGSMPYTVLYQVDENDFRFRYDERGYQSSTSLLYDDEEPVSYSNSLYIQIPEGEHSYAFYSSTDNDSRVYIRIIKSKQRVEIPEDTRIFTPVENHDAVQMITGTTTNTYYRITKDTPIRIAPPPETIVLIYSRLEFEYWMDSPALYRLQLKSGKQIVKTWQFATEQSDYCTYTGESERVPGQYRKVTYLTGMAPDTLDLHLLDSDKSVLVKFRVEE